MPRANRNTYAKPGLDNAYKTGDISVLICNTRNEYRLTPRFSDGRATDVGYNRLLERICMYVLSTASGRYGDDDLALCAPLFHVCHRIERLIEWKYTVEHWTQCARIVESG